MNPSNNFVTLWKHSVLNGALSWAMLTGMNTETKQNTTHHPQIHPVATGGCMGLCEWAWPEMFSFIKKIITAQ